MKNWETYYPIYLDYFKGREDYFACQGRDYYYPVEKRLTAEYLRKHFENLATFGIYVLNSHNKCNFICVDIDIAKDELDAVNFQNPNRKFSHLYNKLLKILRVLKDELQIPENSILLEDTGGRGYHIWIFLQEPLNGDSAVKFCGIIKHFVDFEFEFFPKQASLNEERRFGNLIKLPLGIHQKYNSQSSFFQIIDKKIQFIGFLDDNLRYLDTISKIAVDTITGILTKHNKILKKSEITLITPEKFLQTGHSLYKKDLEFLFKKCAALNRLKNKAEQGVVWSRKEAFHFTNLLLSVEDSSDFLMKTIRASYGSQFRLDLTQKEIENIKPLYPSSCKKLIVQEICDGFCNREIETRSLDSLLPDTNPISFWLTFKRREVSIKKGELLQRIADLDNIKHAYWKSKKYQKEEDVVFYDEFDFEYFEKHLDINTKYIRRAILNKENIPFIGFSKIEMPKKVNDDKKMLYRPLVHSTVFDQVVIQAIFNVVAHELENSMQDCSWGYRCETENLQSENIFHDWREHYPKFRNKVLSRLRQENIKYYICCDIEGFYDNIDHNILLEQLKGHIREEYTFQTVEKLIKIYWSDVGKSKGVPQGPAYARVLANLYLNDFDREILNDSSEYLRYVDDFFLFYQSREEAEKGLRKVFELLNDLGLTPSTEDEKKPEILHADKEERIVSKLDSIQYGIFEEFKFIDYLDIEQVNNFYDAVERHRVSPANLNEVLEINNKLPSIVYLLAKDWEFCHSIRNKLPKIIDYLVSENLFYPKRLKYIFYTIIDLMIECGYDIFDLYVKLHKTHKIYFLLTLYKVCKTKNSLIEGLRKAVEYSLSVDDPFVRGFAILINNDLDEDIRIEINNKDFLNEIFNYNIYFPKVKLLSIIKYFQLMPVEKEILRKKITSESSYLEKKYLLSNLKHINVDYADGKYIVNLLGHNNYFLIIECCELFSSIRDDNYLFNELEKYISAQISCKDIAIGFLTSLVFEKYKGEGPVVLRNQEDLYKEIEDVEIRRELMNEVKRIQNLSLSSGDEFAKEHDCMARYNGCFYFKNVSQKRKKYDFVEMIPHVKLWQYEYHDWDDLRNKLNALAYERILPDLRFNVDSTLKHVSIQYVHSEDLRHFDDLTLDLSLNDILYVFRLIENIYKKADYFFKVFGKVPKISKDNLLVNNEGEVFLKHFGSVLCPLYTISNERIRIEGKNEIPRMISLLMKEIFFQNSESKITSFFEEPKVGIKLFLSYFIRRMSAKNPSLRCSYSRFNYIIQKLQSLGVSSDYQISKLYFGERFKARLFERNGENPYWLSICNALNDLYRDLAETYESIDVKKIDFRNKTFLNFGLPRGMHYLSQVLLNVCLNIENVLKEDSRDNFIDLFELINYFSIFCIEGISFVKATINRFPSTSGELLLSEGTTFKIGDYVQVCDKDDVMAIKTLREKKLNRQNIFDVSMSFTLRQIYLFYLIHNFNYERDDDSLLVVNKANFKNKNFKLLVYNVMSRLPKIERQICNLVEGIIIDLRTNQDLSIADGVLGIKQEILWFCQDINKVRRGLKGRRYFGKRTKLREWPPKIYCRSFLGKTVEATKNKLHKIPLSNLFPSSKSKCSWDICNKKICNLVVPNDRINKLISKLVKGKCFGYKIGYVYSQKAKALWDIIFISLFAVLFIYSFSSANNDSNGMLFRSFCWLTNFVFGAGILFFIKKLLARDIRYWFYEFHRIMQYIHK